MERLSRGISPSSRITSSPHEPGVYYVEGQTWQVGSRYELKKVLGTGSFSSVCLAFDKLEQEKVALKRVGDVFASPDYAKRVLREVCIMRRLDHPNIITLKDVFLKPSATGKYVFRGGRLVPTSYDCYLAMEYCDQGDLFNLRGQLPEYEVHSLLWQLLGALRYIHGLNVWHRDIKTGNLLLTLSEGRRVLKVADFGSARSAVDPMAAVGLGTSPSSAPGQSGEPSDADIGEADAYSASPFTQEPLHLSPSIDMDIGEAEFDQAQPSRRAHAHLSHSFTAQPQHRQTHHHHGGRRDHHTNPAQRPGSFPPPRSAPWPAAAAAGGQAADGLASAPDGGGSGFAQPLTCLVCTPCYRAPEVVMSRGGYSSAIDMWSAGCVFGELLQRVAYVGKATTPHLQVAPVFAISGKPLTPLSGQRYGGAGGPASAAAELTALFSVIGTPAWACIEAVKSQAWRRYLYHIPGRAPTLYRRFGQAGEVAVDLLSRLLQFDPLRRCSAEETMAHEYFAQMHMEAQMAAADLEARGRSGAPRRSLSPPHAPWPSHGAPLRPPRPVKVAEAPAGPGALPAWPPSRSPSHRHSVSGPSAMDIEGEGADGMAAAGGGCQEASAPGNEPRVDAGGAAGAAGGSLPSKRKQLEDDGEQMEEAGAKRASAEPVEAPVARGKLSFWQIEEPALALATLEAELAQLVPPATLASGAAPPLHALDASGSRSVPAASLGHFATQPPAVLAFIEECKERLRAMLELECDMHATAAAARRAAKQAAASAAAVAAAAVVRAGGPRTTTSTGSSGGTAGAMATPSELVSSGTGRVRRSSSGGLVMGPDGQLTMGAGLHGHLRPDPGQQLDPSLIGYERIPYHADAAAACLEPEKHLSAGRHGEWTQSSLAVASSRRERDGASTGTWGVTLLPPGMEQDADGARGYIEAMRSQHAR